MESSEVATQHRGARDDVGRDDVLLGRVLDGRYRILRRLGQGGMGAVYEAEHLALESKVAIKVLQASLSANEKYRKRFLREARAAGAIESKHIVRSSDFGTTEDGQLYFAMELMEGEDLEQHLQSCSRIDWVSFEPLLLQITDALKAAHKRGVIHRDIKPSNCFLCATGSWPPLVKVLDFGIAKINASLADGESPVATLETLTATNELFGTIAYLAPELIEGHTADARSDIYALGILMFRVLTGKLPFTSATVYKVFQQHVSMQVPSLRAMVPEIPAAVESVVFRALAKRPEHRYQTIAELEDALAAAREGVIEPSAAALSGFTVAVQRGVGEAPSPSADTSSSGVAAFVATLPNAPAVTQRVDDPSSLASARIRSPRFSPLAILGLTVVVASGTAAGVYALVTSTRPEPVASSTVVDDVEVGPSAPTAAPAVAPPPSATPTSAPTAQDPLTGAQPETKPTPTPAPGSPASRPAPKSDASARKAPSGTRGTASATGSAPPVKRTLDDLAGAQCPGAVGERFIIEGVLNGEGKYIEPHVTSDAPKAVRDCIKAFIRSRSFGKGRAMEPHTERLSPR